MTITVETTTLKEAAKAAMERGYQYIRLDSLNNCYIEDFLDDLAQGADTADPDDYVRINSFIFRISQVGQNDAELYELDY